ncbi:dimethylhistidine N-methyltransferase [Methylobacterium brachiatum]|uniref:Dimethylhistidine N-methyltransferase n=1 Tax=Methylobacterium brachiatum TaxID=269660 RepID=A0AAJ1WXZ2_9HYPH|nr:L-histidine N(alpha)-methyltransferase [Methylobacterium brachiatum]MCB4804913.1 L-histidine N(alpha)-methyltransferase [Methylobacterium brachiatum]MDQ0545952.1 dimethylhistidine N-methyltransferase [Methylobacterium brachiatum]
MTVKPSFSDATPVALDTPELAFLADVQDGLAKTQKALSPKYFYDSAGSDLFEAITRLPEYYPTRTEIGILDRSGPEMAALLPARAALVEFGSGSTNKLRRLLRHLDKLAAYVPVDVSGEFLRSQAEVLSGDFPHLRVEPVVADFTRDFDLPESLAGMPRAGFFPGSTIGNFEPSEAEELLRRFGRILGEGAHMIVGVDLVKDAAILERAYDDAAGVTAAFNLNLLTRINRELAGRFDLGAFSHRAVFNADASRIEMHLVSDGAQEVAIGSETFSFAAGETIHTESSYKYTVETFRALVERAGWTWVQVWTDPEGLFSVHALRQD